MNLVRQFWQKFKTQPDIWFFYGFLIAAVLSVRKVLFFYPLAEQFNEYTGIYLYLSDILLFLTLLGWGYSILYNNNDYLSMCRKAKHLLILPAIFVAWSFLSLIWADNKIITLFRSLKLAEFYLLYIYLICNVPRLPRENKLFHVKQFGFLRGGTILRNIFRIIIFIGLFESIIAIIQFVIQQSIGLFWLKESLISPTILGVAKFIFSGHTLIRAYGLFPHPDILGGFLLVSIIFTWQYKNMFHRDNNVPRGTLSIDSKTLILLSVQILALILAFCKSAIIGLGIAAVYITWKGSPRLSANKQVEHIWRKAILAIAILLTLVFITRPNINSLFINSLEERVLYLNVSRGTIANNPILGVGMGQFVPTMQNYSQTALEFWQYQPVHTVFLIIWSELGIIGLILFVLLLWKLFHSPRRTGVEQNHISSIFKGILLGFIFVMLFDHYLWDIQQGQILLWLILGLMVSQYKVTIDK